VQPEHMCRQIGEHTTEGPDAFHRYSAPSWPFHGVLTGSACSRVGDDALRIGDRTAPGEGVEPPPLPYLALSSASSTARLPPMTAQDHLLLGKDTVHSNPASICPGRQCQNC
jgi:hypothetical protein